MSICCTERVFYEDEEAMAAVEPPFLPCLEENDKISGVKCLMHILCAFHVYNQEAPSTHPASSGRG